MLRPARTLAVVLALVVIGWQAGNAAVGRFVHPFLVADLVVSAWLLGAAAVPGRRVAAVGLVSGFGAMLGVFLAAVTGRMFAGHFDAGTVAAAVGIAPSLLGIGLAGRSP